MASMTLAQQINALTSIVETLQKENLAYKNTVDSTVKNIEKMVGNKIAPVKLEQDILYSAQHAVSEAINKVLTGYDSPLVALVKQVVNSNSDYLREIISSSFNQVIRTDTFKQAIVDAFSHKVARTMISNNEGLFDKVCNELKQDSVFKAKMALAVSNVVEECLKEKNK